MLKDLVRDDIDGMFFPKKARKNERDLWLDKYRPDFLSESAVHKSKLAELESCLQKMFSKKAPIVLLAGPSGSGKTTTLNLTTKKMNVDVQEWVNPVNDDFIQNNEEFRRDKIFGESQQVKFSEFIFRASRYGSLCVYEQRTSVLKIAVVKDFPNFLLREPTKLRELLMKYKSMSITNPVVFIVTDTEQSSNIKRRLFPANVITELGVEVIKFNPIAPTSMMKALQRIAKMASSEQTKKQDLEEIIQQSNGDIRSACNALQFLCTGSKRTGIKQLKKSKRVMKEKQINLSKNKSAEPSLETNVFGSKDVGISLFRVLGKILHCKRLPDTNTSSSYLPDHLKHHSRPPMSFDPDGIFDKSCLSFNLFSSFLHQNYPGFFSSIEEMSSASEQLSEADTLSREWAAMEKMTPYQASLVTRGIMFARHQTSSKPAWMPLHKPQMLSVTSKSNELSHLIHEHFSNTTHLCNHTQLSTELLPFCALLNHNSTLNNHQKLILYNISHFSHSCRLERFEEKDVIDADTTSNPALESFHLNLEPSNPGTSIDLQAKQNALDSLIEEYDSDD